MTFLTRGMMRVNYIASKIGKPLVMDSCTANMWKYAVGKFAFAWVLLEVPVRKNWMDVVKVRILDPDKFTVTEHSLSVEYDWKPPVCIHCNLFGHLDPTCMISIVKNNSLKPPILSMPIQLLWIVMVSKLSPGRALKAILSLLRTTKKWITKSTTANLWRGESDQMRILSPKWIFLPVRNIGRLKGRTPQLYPP